MINSYPKVYALGHKELREHGLFQGHVVVEEKIDGSQFSFGVFNGEPMARSKNRMLVMDAPDNMFQRAVETVLTVAPLLKEGWIYRGEYLQKPKHNVLAYDRVPEKNVIVFDVERGLGTNDYLTPDERQREAERIGLESIHVMTVGEIHNHETLMSHLDRVSVLGGAKVEGFVVKNHARCGSDKKLLVGKYVSEAFKEVKDVDWKARNPQRADVVDDLVHVLSTEARYRKAVQHLEERGELDGSPKDIGALIKEVRLDIEEECSDLIKDRLYKWARDQIMRRVSRGVPDWYKQRLAESSFEVEANGQG